MREDAIIPNSNKAVVEGSYGCVVFLWWAVLPAYEFRCRLQPNEDINVDDLVIRLVVISCLKKKVMRKSGCLIVEVAYDS